MTGDVEAFAAEVGPGAAGPVVAVGGRTHWDLGGAPAPGAREVRAPVGIVELEPAEMTVRVRAGTPIAELDGALAEHGQLVTLPRAPGSTVGGALSVGRADVGQLGRGPVRDAVLELRYVSADGDVVTAGGPTVKNVSGYDLPRLLVGSLGTLGLLGEVVLRTRPRPREARWYAVEGRDPFELTAALYRPASVLWDGAVTWVLLEGHPADLDEQAAVVGLAAREVEGPPPLPPNRWSLPSGALRSLPEDGLGPFVAQVGVGVVHRTVPQQREPLPHALRALHERVKSVFDPTGRLSPGRQVW